MLNVIQIIQWSQCRKNGRHSWMLDFCSSLRSSVSPSAGVKKARLTSSEECYAGDTPSPRPVTVSPGGRQRQTLGYTQNIIVFILMCRSFYRESDNKSCNKSIKTVTTDVYLNFKKWSIIVHFFNDTILWSEELCGSHLWFRIYWISFFTSNFVIALYWIDAVLNSPFGLATTDCIG